MVRIRHIVGTCRYILHPFAFTIYRYGADVGLNTDARGNTLAFPGVRFPYLPYVAVAFVVNIHSIPDPEPNVRGKLLDASPHGLRARDGVTIIENADGRREETEKWSFNTKVERKVPFMPGGS